jgi:DUF1680 family protein
MKLSPVFAIAFVAALTSLRLMAANPDPQVPFALHVPRDASYRFDGELSDYLRAITDHWLLRVSDENPAMLGMFASRDEQPLHDLLPWSGEFAGKHLTAGSEVLRITGSKKLRESLQKFVERLVTLQDKDGYLGPFPKENRLTGKAPNSRLGGTWDAWGHYHIMLGLLLWEEQSHDPKALACAARIGDLLCDHFLGGGHRVLDMGSPDQNQAIAHGLCLLYERTGTRKYLDLAEQVVTEFEALGAGDYVRTALAGKEFYATPKPRWESLHAIQALAELYCITGKREYRQAFEHIWWSIVQYDRHNNGGFSSGEQAVGNPYDPRPIETCCTIAWIAMSQQMLRLSGNSIVADELELSTMNQVFGLQSRDGAWCTYNTPMDGVRVPSSVDIAFQKRPGSEGLSCCSVNAARGFGMVGDWALLVDEHGGLVLNWYGPCKLGAKVGSTPVALSVVSEYPRSGHIVIRVEPESAKRFSLKLRIPHWSKTTTVSVNGALRAGVAAGSYYALDREWRAGDEVALELDMGIHYWAGEKNCAGKVALYRGPILLAWEPEAASQARFSPLWVLSSEHWVSSTAGQWIEADFEGDRVRWNGRRYDDAGKAIVNIDGQIIDTVDQYGPKRGEPFSWEHAGLGAGRHVIRITISGEKNSTSRGIWTNVTELRAAGGALMGAAASGLPILDVNQLSPRLRDGPAGVLVELSAADGRKIVMRDYAFAGENWRRYVTWLPARGAKVVHFSRDNPLRTQ